MGLVRLDGVAPTGGVLSELAALASLTCAVLELVSSSLTPIVVVVVVVCELGLSAQPLLRTTSLQIAAR